MRKKTVIQVYKCRGLVFVAKIVVRESVIEAVGLNDLLLALKNCVWREIEKEENKENFWG